MGELPVGTVLHGAYCVEKLVAVGGMSRLYLGHPLRGAGRVAIKQLNVTDRGSPAREDLEQFQKEYLLLRELRHRGLAHVLDFFEDGGHHYLVEEFVPGETLEAHIERAGRFSVHDALAVMDQILVVLAYLHDHYVIYRDLKPQNVILQSRPPQETGDDASEHAFAFTVRLVDFGAARRWKPGAVRDTVPLGTPGFASPEQYGSSQSDGRSDVYSAGVLLHYMLTGCLPDPSQGWTFEPPHLLVPQVPVALGRAVMRAVEVDAGRRFPGAEWMRRALARAMGPVEHCPDCGSELPDDEPACPWCASPPHPILVSVGLGLALVGLGVVGLVMLVVLGPR